MEDSLRVIALGVLSARRRRAASLSGVPKTPNLPRSAVPVSDSCVAQVPHVPTLRSTRNTAFAILLPPRPRGFGSGVSGVCTVLCTF